MKAKYKAKALQKYIFEIAQTLTLTRGAIFLQGYSPDTTSKIREFHDSISDT